ncbi:MAG: redoxin domain-containing protein [Nitrospirae bacterium]|nr:redoxin domain-containing protein [Nitrospirota bacterium]
MGRIFSHRRHRTGLLLVAFAFAGAGRAADVRLPLILKSVDGTVHPSMDLASTGALVVVTIKGSWCPVCRTQLERFRKVQAQLDSCGAEVVVVTPDPPERARELQQAIGDRYRVVADPKGEVGWSLGVWEKGQGAMFPAAFLFAKDLSLKWSFRGRAQGLYVEKELLKHMNCEGLAT